MRIEANRFRGTGLCAPVLNACPSPSVHVSAVMALLARCPAAMKTPLVSPAALARDLGVATIDIKDERNRMGLGSFKALGAAYVIACDAERTGASDPSVALLGTTYVTASAGNHGLSIAAGARIFGARAIVHLAETVPEDFADRLRAKGAAVVRSGADYAASMAAAQADAETHGHQLLSDSSWVGYVDVPWRLMEGYLALMDEVADEIAAPPTHIFLQAGVGGLAGAVAAHARMLWGDEPVIVVVEPTFAPALQASILAGAPVETQGPDSTMGRLDCKAPSLIALKGLARDAEFFVTVDDQEVDAQLPMLARHGLATSPSGGAGLAAVMTAGREERAMLGVDRNSRVMAIVTEEAPL